MSDKKVFLALTPLGVAVLDERGDVVDFKLFSKDPKEAAQIYIERGKEELRKVAEELTKQGLEVDEWKKPFEYLSYLVRAGVFSSEEEARKTLNQTVMEISKLTIKKETGWDRYVIILADAIEDLNKIINLMYERLIELYGLYYPEFVEAFEGEIAEFADAVYNLFDRDKVYEKFKDKYKLPEDSVGIDFDEKQKELTREYAKKILEMIELKKKIAEQIEEILKKYMPNTVALCGPLITAKLLSLAGSLERLVRFPASTIQVLGAEKALFRHLMKGTPPPKHGILFQHPLVNRAPKKLRGKIARSLAAKIAIAVKVDYYSEGKKNIADQLKKELDERIKEIYEEWKSGGKEK